MSPKSLCILVLVLCLSCEGRESDNVLSSITQNEKKGISNVQSDKNMLLLASVQAVSNFVTDSEISLKLVKKVRRRKSSLPIMNMNNGIQSEHEATQENSVSTFNQFVISPFFLFVNDYHIEISSKD